MIEMLAAAWLLLAPQEDDPGWDCRVHGDRVCGPTNSQGVSPGEYDIKGNMVDPWPVRGRPA